MEVVVSLLLIDFKVPTEGSLHPTHPGLADVWVFGVVESVVLFFTRNRTVIHVEPSWEYSVSIEPNSMVHAVFLSKD